jgi:predicted metalloprotease with PDZ domain
MTNRFDIQRSTSDTGDERFVKTMVHHSDRHIVRRLVAVLALSLVASAPSFAAEELVKCTASARQCERQIREMLSGRTYLGFKLAESRWGIVIRSVVPDGPAALAGLRAGDRIFAINGEDASKADIAEFKRMLSAAKTPNGRISFGVVRAGQVFRATARFEQMSKEQIDKVVAAHLKEAHQVETHAGGDH